VTQAGNGLFALSALIQHNNQAALEKITTVEVVELVITLLCAHGVEDASIAIYGVTILDAVLNYAKDKGDAVCSFLHKSLVGLKVGTLIMHLVQVYSYNEQNCNVEVIVRAVNLLRLLLRDKASDSTLSDLKKQLKSAHAEKLLRSAVLNNIVIMERHTNQHTEELIAILQH
jgi:histidyl-tRNA synthetase